MKRTACLLLVLGAFGCVTGLSSAYAENTPLNLNPKSSAAAKTPPAAAPPIDAATAIQKANAYFSTNSTMIGDFVQITDPQGYETLVSLFNVDLTKKPDPWLFGLAPPPSEHPVNAN